eukprot:CAMPEP_0117068382 /NCGR_PEP_ID=MMETSP0472-20121206/47940_1 /TAXON_ID=693140 ORGANISM="Tiarina fusus, Strain LIS" /NCGR_SAMPLE_ID=MMETSP0472 /ASSEMBLY_ACC=CAM_ASM_000603 /LENGTH=146 /DNA_ID=CAMNT_0004790451 /DNA_START=280 /DNA_END=717 /DNA_ORIENTATION=-
MNENSPPGRSRLAQSFEDASLPDARSAANRLLTEFRSLLNGVLMEVDSVSTFAEANTLAVLGEKCRMCIADLQQDNNLQNPNRRTRGMDRHQSLGRLFVIKKMTCDCFDDIRGYMFQANKKIAHVSEIAEISDTLSQLNTILTEYK